MSHHSHAHTHEVTSQIVDDILVAAFEGGINYWARKVLVVGGVYPQGATFASDVPSRGGTLQIVLDDAEPGDAPQVLTLDAIKLGIERAASHYGLTVEAFYEEHDAEYADVAVQFALFNEIVYG